MTGPAGLVRAAALAAASCALAGCISDWRRWEPRVVGYMCRYQESGPFGRIDVIAMVSGDGSRVRISADWTADVADDTVSLRMIWRDGLVAPPPGTRLRIEVSVPMERRRWTRLEMHRDGFTGARVYSTSYASPPWRWIETMRWSRFQALIGEAQALHIALVRRNGNLTTDALLPRSILAAPAEAIAAVRPKLEADLADYANHCQPETDPPLAIA